MGIPPVPPIPPASLPALEPPAPEVEAPPVPPEEVPPVFGLAGVELLGSSSSPQAANAAQESATSRIPKDLDGMEMLLERGFSC
jgi:hypothetical protein